MNLGYETEFIEFKISTSQTSRALESIVAMLNKHHKAIIYFGVEDNGEVVGQDIGNKTIKDLSNAITTRIKPQVIPTIKFEVYEEKTVICVECEGSNTPYSADGNYLIRSGCENKKIEPDLLRELVFSNTKDSIVSIESFNQELKFTQIKQLYRDHNIKFEDLTFEKNMGFFTKDNKYNELASLLSDVNDVSIKVVRFEGEDKTKIISRDEYGYRCLIVAMLRALEAVNLFNETRVELDGSAFRKEKRLFEESSLREAWVNACLHTNWAKMIPPAIYIYSNRIEVVSTGGLPLDYPIEDFYMGISHPVNIKLQQIMGQLELVEQTGHGVPEIIKHYGKEAFSITDNHVVVTLKFAFNSPKLINRYENLNVSQKNILQIISDYPTYKTNEIAKKANLSISSINTILKELKMLGKIERIGANKNGYWEIK